MPEDTKKAVEFFHTMRGQLIVGQALAIAVDTLSKVDLDKRELSNIADMQYLLDHVFTIGQLFQDQLSQEQR